MENPWLYPDDYQHCVKLLNNRETERRMFTVPFRSGEAEFDSFLKIAATEREKISCDIRFSIIHQNESLIGVCGFHGVELRHKFEFGYWPGHHC